MAAVIKDTEHKVKLEIADFPLFPRLAILDPEATHAAAQARRRHGHGRDDPRDRGLRPPTGAPTRTPLDACSADDSRHLERAVETPGTRTRAGTYIAANLAITISLGFGARDVAPRGRPVRGAPRRGQRDPPAPRDPLQRGRRGGHRRALPRRGRGPRRRERRRRDGGRRGARHAVSSLSVAWGSRPASPRSAFPRRAFRPSWTARWATA